MGLGRWGGVRIRLHAFFLLFAAFTLYLSWLADRNVESGHVPLGAGAEVVVQPGGNDLEAVFVDRQAGSRVDKDGGRPFVAGAVRRLRLIRTAAGFEVAIGAGLRTGTGASFWVVGQAAAGVLGQPVRREAR